MNAFAKQRVIILGGGFGAFQLAKDISTEHYEVTIISLRDHFLFTPLLASTTVGTLEFRSIIEPLRAAQSDVRSFKASCERIDSANRQIICHTTDSLGTELKFPYDILVIAVGAVSRTFGIPGVEQYALMIKELADARKIRQRIISCVERASLPYMTPDDRNRLLHFVVVGGGPTGVEFAGELHDFIEKDLARQFPELKEYFRITLLEASEGILSSFAKSLGEYAQRHFLKKNIIVRTGSVVKEVKEQELVLADGSLVQFGMLVWSTGVGATPLVKKSDFTKDSSGRIITDDFLRVVDANDIYAIGDCAIVQEHSYPMTGQLAQQQGKSLARTLNRIARKKPAKPFRYLHLGMLAYIGGKRALADTPGVKWRGFVAWLMWRSIYLTKLVSFRNKIRVLFDWIKTSVFGRDTTTF